MVFGFEGGLAGRPKLPLLSSSEMSASVALVVHKVSWSLRDVVTTALGALGSWWTEEGSGTLLPVKQLSRGP